MSTYRMNLSIAINEKYVPYASVMLESLLQNNRNSTVRIFLLQHDLTSESRERLALQVSKYDARIVFLDVKREIFGDKLPTTADWTIEVYFRLLLPDILPEEADRILYLDSDIIINQNLESFYNTDFQNNLLVGCRDLALINLNTEDCLANRNERFRPLFEEQCYINSGVLLINMKELRKKYSFKDYMDLCRELDFQIFSPDQDLINLLHREEISYADEWKYNFLTWIGANNGYDYERTKREVAILHYAGQGPWRGGSHVHYELERFWWEYALQTPYARELAERFVMDEVSDQKLLYAIGGLQKQNEQLLEENARLKENLDRAMDIIKKFSGQ